MKRRRRPARRGRRGRTRSYGDITHLSIKVPQFRIEAQIHSPDLRQSLLIALRLDPSGFVDTSRLVKKVQSIWLHSVAHNLDVTSPERNSESASRHYSELCDKSGSAGTSAQPDYPLLPLVTKREQARVRTPRLKIT
jgi:hypothetical protein